MLGFTESQKIMERETPTSSKKCSSCKESFCAIDEKLSLVLCVDCAEKLKEREIKEMILSVLEEQDLKTSSRDKISGKFLNPDYNKTPYFQMLQDNIQQQHIELVLNVWRFVCTTKDSKRQALAEVLAYFRFDKSYIDNIRSIFEDRDEDTIDRLTIAELLESAPRTQPWINSIFDVGKVGESDQEEDAMCLEEANPDTERDPKKQKTCEVSFNLEERINYLHEYVVRIGAMDTIDDEISNVEKCKSDESMKSWKLEILNMIKENNVSDVSRLLEDIGSSTVVSSPYQALENIKCWLDSYEKEL